MTTKSADDPSVDYKALVRRGYDRCAAEYDKSRQVEAPSELSLFTDGLVKGAKVLDIGCGAGVPVTRALVQHGFLVTGTDLSSEMISRARRNVPKAVFIESDIMDVKFPPGHFDAIVSFYAIFHLPRECQTTLFHRIHLWLKKGGYLLVTVSQNSEEPYTEDDFFGVTMYWSNFGLEEYQKLLGEIGFNVLDTGVVGHGFSESKQHSDDEHHPLIFAQKM